jgi:hypothetical protein
MITRDAIKWLQTRIGIVEEQWARLATPGSPQDGPGVSLKQILEAARAEVATWPEWERREIE